MIKQKKAQSSLEYALVIAAVAAALIAMKVYIQRGMQGKLREVADSLGNQYNPATASFNLTENITSYTKTISVSEGPVADNRTSTTTHTELYSIEKINGTDTGI